MKQAFLKYVFLIALVSAVGAPLHGQANSSASLELPSSDDGLPGEGPLRRYDWFRNLWKERRSQWAARAEQDRGSVVLLGDSITQGWGEDFSAWFPGMKIANRGISGDTTRGVLIRMDADVLKLNPRATPAPPTCASSALSARPRACSTWARCWVAVNVILPM